MPRGRPQPRGEPEERGGGNRLHPLSGCRLGWPRLGGLILGYGAGAAERVDEAVRTLACRVLRAKS
jgi:hypothetical protein